MHFHIFLARKCIFSNKTFNNEDILQKFLNFLENYFKNFKFSIFMEPPYKLRELSYECYYILYKFIKRLNKIGLDP